MTEAFSDTGRDRSKESGCKDLIQELLLVGMHCKTRARASTAQKPKTLQPEDLGWRV